MPTEPTTTAQPRVVAVPAERLAGWIERFAGRHGRLQVRRGDLGVELMAPDGAAAMITVPFPPLPPVAEPVPDQVGEPLGDPVGELVAHVVRPRRVGAILVRRGGYAIGIFDGASLVRSKVGSCYVQGKTKAGGWSQQRYARRRANQTDQAYAEAADVAASILLPAVDSLAAVFGGGDRGGVRAVLAEPRLAPLLSLLHEPVLPTVDPRLRVLEAFPEQFRAVEITLNRLA